MKMIMMMMRVLKMMIMMFMIKLSSFFRIVLRNYVAQHVIDAAERGDYNEVKHLNLYIFIFEVNLMY